MSIREIVRFVVCFLVTAASVFLSAGTLAWRNGWMFMAVISAAVAAVTFGIFRASPELMRERRTAAKAAKPWDRALVPAMTGLPFVAVIVAGLGKRLGWASPFPEWSAWVAFGAMALGSALAYWGMKANRFFSSYVRIQTDRGHQVVESGPYAYLRHPGYAGAILFTLGTPILLNSIPAFVLAVITTLIIVLRTFLEDRTLRQELPGYQQYAQTVRYRLLPLVW
jgi:protein-S-isoprenylcysteine O-methyltransferase Ste14